MVFLPPFVHRLFTLSQIAKSTRPGAFPFLFFLPFPDQGVDLADQKPAQEQAQDQHFGLIDGVVEVIDDGICKDRQHQNDQRDPLGFVIHGGSSCFRIFLLLYQFPRSVSRRVIFLEISEIVVEFMAGL